MNSEDKRTKTSTYGSSARVSHDASEFYSRKIYSNDQGLSQTSRESNQQTIPEIAQNRCFSHSSETMCELPDNSVHLMVTSPPYNVGKEYDEDLSLSEYTDLLTGVFTECYRVLVDGGRACVNIANVGRKPYIALNALVNQIMAQIGYNMRGEIIWNKGASAGVSCAWGSWMSPSNPVLRDVHEYILVYSKGSYGRPSKTKKRTISKEEFLEFTKSIWSFSATSARKVGHPAPFPVELPRRLIQLYSYENDTVLDPFMGSGPTAVASVISNRSWVGYEISEEYCELTNVRVSEQLVL